MRLSAVLTHSLTALLRGVMYCFRDRFLYVIFTSPPEKFENLKEIIGFFGAF